MKSFDAVSFDDTKTAFASQTDADLKMSNLLFSSMRWTTLVKIGTFLTPLLVKSGLPIKGIIKKTLFKQFVGGETLQETALVSAQLDKYGVNIILDYGVEGGYKNNEAFDQAAQTFIEVIKYAAAQKNIPYISIKVTAFASFELLEKMDENLARLQGTLQERYEEVVRHGDSALVAEWQKVVQRFEKICLTAAQNKVGVLVDAEESWIQDCVDAITMKMMCAHNKKSAYIYNTIQLYRHDRMAFLERSEKEAKVNGFVLGVKIVRGAYMEKERKRAAKLGYRSPIQPNKNATDVDYNKGLSFCIEHIENVSLVIASHNEESNLFALRLIEDRGLAFSHKHIHFSQLYGMSDHITFNLAAAGCSVSKYLPFGPIKEVVPYLMRRAQENSAIAGQVGRELGLIKKEIKRRGL